MIRVRVAAYVLRERTSWELLVFEQEHSPAAGVQVPAGGVLPDETLEMAVLREVTEETGLDELAVRTELHTEQKPHSLTGTPHTTTFFVVDASGRTPDAWTHLVRGVGADAGMGFRCRFVALPMQHALADDQDAGLGLIDESFTTLARRTRHRR